MISNRNVRQIVSFGVSYNKLRKNIYNLKRRYPSYRGQQPNKILSQIVGFAANLSVKGTRVYWITATTLEISWDGQIKLVISKDKQLHLLQSWRTI